MTAFSVLNIRDFMQLLFSETAFDSFSFVDADIKVSVDYHIEGRVNMNFYSEEELEQLRIEEFAKWGDIKEQVKDIIKGKRLPVAMKITLKKAGAGDITYVLNIRFDSGNLMLVTGTARSVFTTDRSGEEEWDEKMCGFLKIHNIQYEKK